uniref:Uncharacterized protein n=1 Tax=Arundo donax TaxID=35708 RepID=A0A0A9AWL1_ARUDO
MSSSPKKVIRLSRDVAFCYHQKRDPSLNNGF